MMKEYAEVASVILNELSYEFEWHKERVAVALLEGGYYDLAKVRQELNAMLADKQFDWIKFAAQNKLIWDVGTYTAQDVLYELKYAIWETVFPEYATTPDEWAMIRSRMEQIACTERGWIEGSWLFHQASLMIGHPTYYNSGFMEKSINKGVLEVKKNDKEDCMGYLRYSFFYRCNGR